MTAFIAGWLHTTPQEKKRNTGHYRPNRREQKTRNFDEFGELKTRRFDWGKLGELLSGATVIGIEPVDYPVVDECWLYAEKDGSRIAIQIRQAASVGYDELKLAVSVIPPETRPTEKAHRRRKTTPA